MSYKSLPEEAVELVEVIQQEQQILTSTLETCINEGLDQQNFELVQKLLPRIRSRAALIKKTSRDLQRQFTSTQRRRGRLPKWVEVMLEITALADRVIQCVDLAEPEIQPNRWVTIDHLLRNKCRDFNRRIGKEVSVIATTSGMITDKVEIPQIMRQIFDEGKK